MVRSSEESWEDDLMDYRSVKDDLEARDGVIFYNTAGNVAHTTRLNNVDRIRFFRDGRLCALRAAPKKQAPAVLSADAEAWPEFSETPTVAPPAAPSWETWNTTSSSSIELSAVADRSFWCSDRRPLGLFKRFMHGPCMEQAHGPTHGW